MVLKDIIGNNKAKESLIYKVTNNEIANSYMFVGISGIGKKLIAKEFARLILCQDIKEEKECESCLKFNSENHPDFKEIKPDNSSIKISQIRELGEIVYKKPILSKRKVIIIDDADLMTEEAQNALLKTLEEPPEYIVIILIVSNESLLLNTIKSRCVKIKFYGLSNDEMLKYVDENGLEEKPSEILLEFCNGSIGRLLDINQKKDIYTFSEEYVNYILYSKEKISIIDLMKKSDFMYKSKQDINFILDYILTDLCFRIKKDEITSTNIFNLIDIIKDTMEKVKTNANYDMCIDEMNFKICEKLKL